VLALVRFEVLLSFRCEEIDSIVKSKGPPEGQDKSPCSTAISIL
jgi:hypothetical protein